MAFLPDYKPSEQFAAITKNADAAKLVSVISEYSNRCGINYDNIGKAMASDHRYLQNEMFKIALAYIKQLAYSHKAGQYDMRNETACKEAATMYGALIDNDLVWDMEYTKC
jgi:hypothetical protein